jgi:hypothetical protein
MMTNNVITSKGYSVMYVILNKAENFFLMGN